MQKKEFWKFENEEFGVFLSCYDVGFYSHIWKYP